MASFPGQKAAGQPAAVATGTVPNITALPTNYPAENDTAYNALNVGTMAAGTQFNDPVTNVVTWKVTASGTPGTSFYGPAYAEGPNNISLPWGPNLDQYTLVVTDVNGGGGTLVDFGLSTSTTPGFRNYRAAPTGFASYPQTGAATFSRLAPAAHPKIMYVVTAGKAVRLFDADASVMAFVDSNATAYGYSASWPSTGWPWSIIGAGFGWLTTSADESWMIGNNGASGANATWAINLQNGTTQTLSRAATDDSYMGYGPYVTFDGTDSLIWDLNANTTSNYSLILNAANGWNGSQATSHMGSSRGYWTALNSNGSGSLPYPVATIVDVTTNLGQTTIGTQSTPPNIAKAWGQSHESGQWWYQTSPAQYFLTSNWDDSQPGVASEKKAITFWDRTTGQGYRLGHSYSIYQAVGATTNYYTQPHACLSIDGKLCMFESDMLGNTRIDCFLMEVPVKAGTPPSYP